MSVSRLRIHVYDATSGASLPNLYDCIQLLRLSNLEECSADEPTRTIIQPLASTRLPALMELQIQMESPFIAEVRVYDPPLDVWPTQEWVLLRPGQEEEIRVAVFPDAASFPGNGRDKLRAVLLGNVSQLGSYAAIKGRLIAPEGPEAYELFDSQVWLKNVEGVGQVGTRRLFPEILPETMAEPWSHVPIAPGTWDLVVAGPRIEIWSRRLELAPGQTFDLGDVRLTLRDLRQR